MGEARAQAFLGESTHALAGLRRLFEYYRVVGDIGKAVEAASYPIHIETRGIVELCREALELVPEGSLEAGRLLARCGAALAYQLGSPRGGLMIIHGMYPGVSLENARALMDAIERYASYFA